MVCRIADTVLEGTFAGFDANDLTDKGVGDFAVFEGASSGLIGEEDRNDAADVLQPGASAALLIYENTWAAPFATQLRKDGAQLVAAGRIPVNAIISALDELEADES